ncbi:spore germination protein [Cytobacillus suaedae]|nr:spore germination protein [Cytobacillus suaedae]
MPSVVGPVNINSNEGVLNLGDSFYISPKGSSKSSLGSGAANTGDFHIVNNVFSATNAIDPDANDSNITANA